MPQKVNTNQTKPRYVSLSTHNGTGTRQAITSTAAITNMTTSYTSGRTNEILFITGSALMQPSVAPGRLQVYVGGTGIGPSAYIEHTGYTRHFVEAYYEIAANTTVTIDLRAVVTSGTTTVANANNDLSAYWPQFNIIAFGR